MNQRPTPTSATARAVGRATTLGFVLLATACGYSGGGGSFAATVAGSACFVVEGAETCGVADGVGSRLRCDAGVWVQLEACAGGVCTNSGAQLTACAALTGQDAADGGGGGDAGTSDGGGGGDAGTSDAATAGDGDAPGDDTGAATDTATETDTAADTSAGTDTATETDTAADTSAGTDTSVDAGASGSCVGKCGTYDQAASCQCDTGCSEFGDCCADWASVCGGATDAGTSDGGTTDAGTSDASGADAGGTTFVYCDPPCGSGSYCDQGSCIQPSCALPASAASKDINLLTSLTILPENQGCDLNDDGKPDNVFSKLVSLYPTANQAFADALASGTFVAAFVPKGWTTGGQTFQIAATTGRKVNGGVWLAANAYDLGSSAATCPILEPMVATAPGGSLLASGGVLTLGLPVVGLPLALKISDLKLGGTASGPSLWTSLKSGTMCGGIKQQDLVAAVEAIPADIVAETGFDKADILTLLQSLFKFDLDTDDDGVKDSISIAFSVETAATPIAGFE